MKHVHIEWIRSFLLSKYNSFLSNYQKSKDEKFTLIASHRFLLMSPGTQSFIKHDLFSLAVSVIDPNYHFDGSDFFNLVNHISQFVSTLRCSVTELNSNTFTSSHDRLASSILILYIRSSLKPSFVSPTVFGLDTDAYKRAFTEWGRSMSDGKLTRLPADFKKDFGTGQVVCLILMRSKGELIRLNRLCFDPNPSRIEILNNWKELDVALGVLNVRRPTLDELDDELCLLCFCTDLYAALYGINRKIVTLSKPKAEIPIPEREFRTIEEAPKMSLDRRVDVDIPGSPPAKAVRSKKQVQEDDVIRIKSRKKREQDLSFEVREEKSRHRPDKSRRYVHEQLPEAPKYLHDRKKKPSCRHKEKSKTKCSYVTFDVFENSPPKPAKKAIQDEDSLIRTDQIQIADAYGAVVVPAERTKKRLKEPKKQKPERQAISVKSQESDSLKASSLYQRKSFLLSDSSDDEFGNAENVHDLIHSVSTFLAKDRGVFVDEEEKKDEKEKDLVKEVDEIIAKEKQRLRGHQKKEQSKIQVKQLETVMKRPRVPSEDQFEEISGLSDDEDPILKLAKKAEMLSSSIKRLTSMMHESESEVSRTQSEMTQFIPKHGDTGTLNLSQAIPKIASEAAKSGTTESELLSTKHSKTRNESELSSTKKSAKLSTTNNESELMSTNKSAKNSTRSNQSGLMSTVTKDSATRNESELLSTENTKNESQLTGANTSVSLKKESELGSSLPLKEASQKLESDSEYYPSEDEPKLHENAPQEVALSLSDKSDPLFKLEPAKEPTPAQTDLVLSVLGETTQNISTSTTLGQVTNSVPVKDDSESTYSGSTMSDSSDSVIPFTVIPERQTEGSSKVTHVPTLELSTAKPAETVDDDLNLDLPSPTSSDKNQSVQELHDNTAPLGNGDSAIIAEDYPSDTDTGSLFAGSQSLAFPESLSALTDVRSSLNNKASVIAPFDTQTLRDGSDPLLVPIKLSEEPMPVQDKKKENEPKRVSFKFDSVISSFSKLQSSTASLSESSQMSTTAKDMSLSLPVAERLRRYQKEHSRLSLSLTGDEPSIVKDYFAEAKTHPDRFTPLTSSEQAAVAVILPRLKKGDSDEVYDLVVQELGLPKQNPIVMRLASNILEFVKGAGVRTSLTGDDFF